MYWLAPMESVSDEGYRSLCRLLGADFSFTEMIRASAFNRKNPSTLSLIDTYTGPVGVQFLTKSPAELKKTLELFFTLREEKEYAHLKNITAIDLNFGCPSPDIIKMGAGPALLKRTTRMKEIIRTLSRTKEYDKSIAIGVKLRLGLNQKEKEQRVIYRFSQTINEELDFCTLHAKHAGQRGSEKADWDEMREFRKTITTKFLANGSAHTKDQVHALQQHTKADGVMIARGAFNPWIFRELKGGAQAKIEEIEQAHKNYLATKPKKKFLEYNNKLFSELKKSQI